ncbi:antibiotic biosynthesis monooxygenase [Modestobacter sp. URMC 112]
MYARTTTVHADPQRVDEGIRYIRDEVMPAVQSMPGCMGLSMLCDRDSGRCIVTTSWDSQESMGASREAVRAMREQANDVMGGRFDVDEWEIAVMHRAHALNDGAWARVTYSRLQDASQADRVIEAWKTNILPRLDELDGFSSVSLMVDRSAGRGVGTMCLDDRQALDASREASGRMRSEFAARIGVEITDVVEMEVAIHHLRVPEMA